jgi:isopentenyl diphosphate isomerase/L-lactate dehydrogenase-like FMN-dependent dehydrogenase
VRNIEDVRSIARRRLPRIAFDFVEGGAEDEVTLRANRSAFQELALRPRWLQDVAERDQSTTVLGRRVETPVLLAPVGLARIAHRDADVAAARAAVAHGTIYTLSTNSSTSIEEVAARAPGDHWFQLYLWRRPERVEELVRRVQAAGFSAMVVTVDVPVVGRRERDLANGFTLPVRLRPAAALDLARHPRWVRDVLAGPPITFRNFSDASLGANTAEVWKTINAELTNPAATFRDLERFRSTWEGPLLIKGTMTAEDAEQAIECGVDGIVVSNHGGRQIDGVQATVDALPEIVEAARGRAEVLLDGGVRRGTDVVKALALGARAVMVGRAWVYGAAAGGEAGVAKAIALLRTEIDSTLALIGRRSVADVDRSCVTYVRAARGERDPVELL